MSARTALPRARGAARAAQRGSHGTAVLAWTEHLDALEEWVRRTHEVIADGSDEAVGPLACTPSGDLPAGLRTRAAAALQALDRLAVLAERRRRELARAEAYRRY